jgi:septum formation protein
LPVTRITELNARQVRYPGGMPPEFVYLASGSPRRRELLTQIGVPFRVLAAPVDETVAAGEAPETYVVRVAEAKAAAGWSATRAAPAPVLAADTTVILDGRILLKPRDREDGERMLLELAGRTHQVLTAVSLALPHGVESRLCRSEVALRPICAAEARSYWDTGEPEDKAGAYAIQGRAAIFIARLSGSYSGVMGLPLFETAALLEQARVPRWR